jgi:flagellar protein FlaG
MEAKVAAIASASAPGLRPKPRTHVVRIDPAPEAMTPDPVELRLVIEEDEAGGGYVYKTINRATGEIVQQLPRAEVLKLKHAVKYEAGTIVRAGA